MLDLLQHRFEECAGDEAIAWRDQRISYGELSRDIARLGDDLEARGLRPGTTVLLEADFSPRAVALLLALLGRGLVVGLATGLPESKSVEYSELCQAQHRIRLEDGEITLWEKRQRQVDHPLLCELRQRQRPGLVIFSSGSSGAPKASVHDAERLLRKFERPARRTRVVAFLLFDHIGGLNLLFYALFNRGTIIIARERTPDAVAAAIATHRADALTTTPTFLRLALVSGAFERHDVSSLRFVNYSSEVMPQNTLDELRSALPQARLSQSYGLTEVGVLDTRSRSSESLFIKLGGGKSAADAYQIRIRDGLLEIRAHSTMLGYLNAPSPFTEDGWFRTGDAVEIDGDYVRILGRTSELINVGGQKVYPAEVEGVLQEIPGVLEVVVTGEPHPLTGQLVCAAVSLAGDETIPQFSARMRRLARARLPSYMVPQKIVRLERDAHGARFKKLRQPNLPTPVKKETIMTAQQRFHQAVAKLLEVTPEDLPLEATLDHYEAWDSLAMSSVVALVDEHFKVSISAEAVRQAQSLADLLSRVAEAPAVTPTPDSVPAI
jgi:long-chain acyl-CoA synthetase